MGQNVKETIKNAILLFLVVFFIIFFVTSKGNDELNLNLDFLAQEEEFSYPVYASEYNGQYRNLDGNGIYAFVGKNVDDTYRIYFIKTVRSMKAVMLKIDNAKIVNGKTTFVDTTNPNSNNIQFDINFSTNEFSVTPSSIGFSNEQLDGSYLKTKNIEQFSLSEFEF